MEKILLHSCCAPCSTAVIERLAETYDITILYYNPNIYPEEEYEKRKAEQKRYLKIWNEKNPNSIIKFMDCDYDSESYFLAVKGLENEKEGGSRCAVCFKLRLMETARLAKANAFDIFGTTLTVSPHKNAELINAIGKAVANEFEVPFLESNFKKQDGYKRSIELSKNNDLYRQNYCGCKFTLEFQNK